MTPPIVVERERVELQVMEAAATGTAPARAGVPMGMLPDRARAVVVTIVAEDELKRPLLDLGLTPGTEILVVRRAPLRDPIEVYVRGCHFSIRREEANRILVEAV
ncbi:MAG TPA: FeoA family protein [Candidatus Eisenbacteria bacterium]|nr:FeoA family protein [Candidatus Eisenbacteria bacterium]